ncbi:MAG: hypothetical protein E7214_03285 [Clostridium sp.]|nr:hypothetical protein [Clostridium sp.]
MQLYYIIKYFKYMIMLRLRRRCSSLEKILKKFSLHISYKELLIILLVKYIIEVCSLSSVVYFIIKDNKEMAKQFIFPFAIIYLIIYTINSFVNNYNKIIKPENEEFLKIFPISELKRNIIIYTNAFIFCIFESFIKKILQILMPFVFIFERISIVGILLGITFLLVVSILIAIIIILLKFAINRGKVSIINTSIYIVISACIYKLTSSVINQLIIILNTFPFDSLKSNNEKQVDIWVNYVYDISNRHINYFINEYLNKKYYFISIIRDMIQGKGLAYNIMILLGYIIIIASMTLMGIFLYKSVKNKFLKKQDIISIWVKFIKKISNLFVEKFMYEDISICKLIYKDLNIFNLNRKIVNSKFFDIFGGIQIWIFIGSIVGIQKGLTYIEDGFYIKYFHSIMILFVPLFILIGFQEKIKEDFKFIFLVDGENKNINLFKVVGYPIKYLYKEKLYLFFFFSIPIYIIFFLIYIVFLHCDIYELIVLFLNLIFIYYFGTSFQLIGLELEYK